MRIVALSTEKICLERKLERIPTRKIKRLLLTIEMILGGLGQAAHR